MRHVLYIEGYFDCISFEFIMHISNAVFKGFVLDVNNKSFSDLTSVLNLVEDPVRNNHSAIKLSIKRVTFVAGSENSTST